VQPFKINILFIKLLHILHGIFNINMCRKRRCEILLKHPRRHEKHTLKKSLLSPSICLQRTLQTRSTPLTD
jgi:hypothetical protein